MSKIAKEVKESPKPSGPTARFARVCRKGNYWTVETIELVDGQLVKVSDFERDIYAVMENRLIDACRYTQDVKDGVRRGDE